MQIFKYEIVRNFTVITLEVQTLDRSNVRTVSNRILEAMQDEALVVVDLGAIRYFDVNGFAAMLQWAAGAGGLEVQLCSSSGTVHALFELLSAHTLVPLHRSREEAMAYMNCLKAPLSAESIRILASREQQAVPARRSGLES